MLKIMRSKDIGQLGTVTVFKINEVNIRVIWHETLGVWSAKYRSNGEFVAGSSEETLRETIAELRHRLKKKKDPKYREVTERLGL